MVSIICTIFLLHPTITKSTLGLFECLRINDNSFRVRMHMDYECYSTDHLMWLSVIGIPNLIIWVIFCPAFAFIILFRNRNKLDDESVKQYYLILYQGIERNKFYWEFVNTLRKTIVLSVNTVLSMISTTYRIIFSVTLLIVLIRIQERLRPFKSEANNKIEIKSTIAGTIVLYCGILFEETSNEEGFEGFSRMAFMFLIVVNVMFILDWLYLFLKSFKFEGTKMKILVNVYATIL